MTPHPALRGQAPPPGAVPTPRPGLRERKKIQTRIAIRAAAHRLIDEQGYEHTTIEQIADAAVVSPSTVFRYFPAKEDLVLPDEPTAAVEAALRARPLDEPPLVSLRTAIREGLRDALTHECAELTLRTRLMVDVPAVRGRMMETACAMSRMLCRVLAERTGADPEGLDARVHAAALVGGLVEAVVHWAEHGQGDDLLDVVDQALDIVEHGPAAH